MKDKICIQWALKNAKNYLEIPLAVWSNQPKKPESTPGSPHSVNDNNPGWIHSLCFQGTLFKNCDHYAVIPLSDGSDPSQPYVKIISWIDDLDDHDPDKLYANEFTFYPIQPDPKLGDEDPATWPLNTRCEVKHYTGPGRPVPPIEGWEILPWSLFVPPDPQFVRHGKWVSDQQYIEHHNARTERGWREWGPDGVVPPQRPLGKYRKPKGTRTYYQRDTILANGVHTAANEQVASLTAGAGETLSENTNGGSDELSFVFTGPSNEPDQATWPDGVYRCQFDANTIDTNMTFGLRTVGGSAGHFGRVNSAVSSEVATKTQSQGAFGSPAGLKLATVDTTGSSWGGSTQSDRAEWTVAQASGAAHGNETLGLTFDSDAFLDGPWSAPGVSGDLAFTDVMDTVALSGDVLVQGDLAFTDVMDTVALSGDVLVQGDLAFTDVMDTVAMSGTVADPPITGDLAFTDVMDTVALSGDVLVQGDLAFTDVMDTVAMSGDVLVQGDLAFTDVMDTVALSGDVVVQGDLAFTDVMDTVAFNGGTVIFGDLAFTDVMDTVALSGDVLVQGDLAFTDVMDTVALSGDVLVQGDLAFTDVMDTVAMSGTVGATGVSGDLAFTDVMDTVALSGDVLVQGDLAFTDVMDTVAMSGTVGFPTITGDLAFTDVMDTVALSGDVLVQGDLAFTDVMDTVALGGTVLVQGDLAFTDVMDVVVFFQTAPYRITFDFDLNMPQNLKADCEIVRSIDLDLEVLKNV